MPSNSVTEYGNSVLTEYDISRPDSRTIRMLSILVEEANIPFFITAPAGEQFTFLSRAAGDLLGYPIEELMCKPVKSVVTPTSLKDICKVIQRAAATGNATDGIINLAPQPIDLIRKDQSIWSGELRCSLQLATNHTVTSISGIVTPDTTANEGKTSMETAEKTVKEDVVSIPPTEQTAVLTETRQGKILIMDDEEILIDIASQIGKRIGLNVECARNGSEAISLYKEALEIGEPHDAILLDMTIVGGKGGLETARELLALDPGVVAIVMSGYSDHEVMANPAKYGFKGVISKPFRLAEFGRVLHELIPEAKFIPK